MADEIAPVSSVSSSSSSSSTQSTNTNNNTQSTSESSSSSSTSSTSESSSSSSSTSSSEKSPEINTSDSSNISPEASEADEADDGSQLNMSWITGDAEAYEEAAIDKSTQKANALSGEISVDYARQFDGEQTCFINKDGENLLGLQRQCTDKNDANYSDYKTNNCANFVSSVLVATGRTDDHINTVIGLKDNLLNNEGYKLVSADEAQAGDVWMHIGSDYRHVEIVTGRDENGNITTIGSNNIYDANGNNTHEQAVSERSKTDSQVTGSNNFILHKDFTADELKNISETLENNSIYDTSAEKVAGAEVSAEASPSAVETMSDISALTSELDKIDDIKAGNYQSLSGYQSGNITEQLKEKASKLDSTDNPVLESVKSAISEKVDKAEDNGINLASTASASGANGVEATNSKDVAFMESRGIGTEYNTDVKGAGVNYTGNDQEIASFINKYIEDKGSPIAGQGAGEMMVKYGKEYGVDPMILLSIAQAETGLGTTGIGQDGMLGVGAYDDDPNNATRNSAFSGFETQIRRGAETFDKLREQAGLTADASLHDQLKAVNEQGWASANDWYDLVERCYNPIAKKAVNAGIAEMKDGSYVAPSNSVNEVSSSAGQAGSYSPASSSYSGYPSAGSSGGYSGYPSTGSSGGYSGYPSTGSSGGYSPASYDYSGYPSAGQTASAGATQQTGKLEGNSQQEQIWNYLHQLGLNDIAASGIMGNMAQESGYASNNVQNSYEGKVGSDQSYTAGVDNGSISRDSFAHDGAGYGLVQFTYSGYKEGLYDMAKSRGTSVSDIGTQLDFLASQMNTGLIQRLNSAGSPQEAARIFEVEFEKAGTPNMAQRQAYATQAYNQFANA